MDCAFEPTGNGRYFCPVCDEEKVRTVRIQRARRNCRRRTAGIATSFADQNPTFYAKAKHYAAALTKWGKAGFPVRTTAEAQACRDVCLACPSGKYDAQRDACRVCGCTLAITRIAVRSKLRMATEDCPLHHWPRPSAPSVHQVQAPTASQDAREQHDGDHHPESEDSPGADQ